MTEIAAKLDPRATRRSFLQAGAALGGGLVIGWQAHAVHGKVAQFQQVWAEFSETKRFWRAHR